MRLAAIVVGLMVVAVPAWAETTIVFECGESSGWTYFPEGGLISQADAGWREDAISGGRIQLVMTDGALDLIHLDAAGLNSAKSYGAKVFPLDVTAEVITVVVNYDAGAKEFYSYLPEQKKLYWTQHKFNMPIDKVAAFKADCS